MSCDRKKQYVCVHVCVCTLVLNSQAVDHSPPVSTVILLLPLGQPPHQLEDGAFGERCVPVGRPANELKVLHQAVTILRLTNRWKNGQLSCQLVHLLLSYHSSCFLSADSCNLQKSTVFEHKVNQLMLILLT